MKRLVRFVGIVGLVISGCSENEKISINSEAYFPLQTGMFWVYDINETTYTAFDPPQTSGYELRTELVDSFPNPENGYTYVMYRYTRLTDTDPWEYLESWSVRVNEQYAIVSEENTSFARLAFPLYEKRQWNGNLFNALGEDEYVIDSMTDFYSVDEDTGFENAAVVLQENVSNNLVYRDVRKEVYAEGIGLVVKESQVWNYNCSGGTCTGEITDGYELIQVLKEHGKN